MTSDSHQVVNLNLNLIFLIEFYNLYNYKIHPIVKSTATKLFL